jgi:hypothetical protein
MNIELIRLDGGLKVTPAPPYITKYLRYSHRQMGYVNYKRQTIFEERLLHKTDGSGGIYTLQGFFHKLCKLIHKNNDTFVIKDVRAKMPDIDWERVKTLGPKEYQIDAIADGLTKGCTESGIYNATGGFGFTY